MFCQSSSLSPKYLATQMQWKRTSSWWPILSDNDHHCPSRHHENDHNLQQHKRNGGYPWPAEREHPHDIIRQWSSLSVSSKWSQSAATQTKWRISLMTFWKRTLSSQPWKRNWKSCKNIMIMIFKMTMTIISAIKDVISRMILLCWNNRW